MHNHANGQYGHAHGEHHFSYLPAIRPFPRLLKDAGYATGYIAKLHVAPEQIELGLAVFSSCNQVRTVTGPEDDLTSFDPGPVLIPHQLSLAVSVPAQCPSRSLNPSLEKAPASSSATARAATSHERQSYEEDS